MPGVRSGGVDCSVMKRRLFRVVMCLFLGIAATALVAVGCMLWGLVPDLFEMQPRLALGNWPRAVPADWPPPTAQTVYKNPVHTLILHQTIRYADPPSDSTAGATHHQWLYQYGWPLRAFEAESRATSTKPPELFAALGPVPSWLLPGGASLRHVATRPIWHGLLLDSLLYAVLAWSVLAGSRATLRLSRLTRDRCPACNYDLRGNLAQGCPECGWRRVAEG